MRQQIFETALSEIVTAIETQGSTRTHDTYGDRKKLNQLVGKIKHIAKVALDRSEKPGDPDAL